MERTLDGEKELGEDQFSPSSATKKLCELKEGGREKSASLTQQLFSFCLSRCASSFSTSLGFLYFYQYWGKCTEGERIRGREGL